MSFFIMLQVICPNNKCYPYQPPNFNLTVCEIFKAELYFWSTGNSHYTNFYLQNLSVNGLLNNFVVGAEAFS